MGIVVTGLLMSACTTELLMPAFGEDDECFDFYEGDEEAGECDGHWHCSQPCGLACESNREQPLCPAFSPVVSTCPADILDDLSCRCVEGRCRWVVE